MEPQIGQVLIVDDDPDYRQLVGRFLLKSFPDATPVEYDPVLQGRPPDDFDWSRFDLLILDYHLSTKETGLDWLRTYKTAGMFPATIVLTGAGDEEVAVRSMKFGAQDYLRKEGLTAKRFSDAILDAVAACAKERAEQDALTLQGSIFNKSLFYSRLESASRETERRDQYALLLVQLDDHHKLHQEYGLLTLDNTTRHVAKNIGAAFSDLSSQPNITRIGDASVAVLVENYGETSQLEAIAAKACEHLAATPFQQNDVAVHYTLSIGVVPLSDAGPDAHAILAAADDACRKAAERGENAYSIYSAGKTAEPVPVEAVPAKSEPKVPLFDAHSAFKENRVVNFFQPVVSISDKVSKHAMEIYEVRVRMVRLDGDLVEAGEVMAAIERQGIERILDRWSIRECIGRLVEAHDRNLVFLIKMNPQSIADKNLADWLDQLIAHAGGLRPGNSLGMEITADEFMKHQRSCTELMERLRGSHDVKLVLTGVNGVPLLNVISGQTTVDFIKLSDDLNRELTQAGEEAPSAQLIINRARELDILTIAERIEDVPTLSAVITAGVDLVQGYFVGMPQSELGEPGLVEALELG